MGQISFLIGIGPDDAADRLRALLEQSGHASVLGCVPLEGLADAVRQHAPDAIFADLGSAPEAAMDCLEHLPTPRPRLLVAGPEDDAKLLRRAMRLGVREFFGPEADAGAIGACLEELTLERAGGGEDPQASGHIVSVVASKGGIGSTTLACQLGAALQEHASTAVVDLDLAWGDVAVHFDVRPQYSLADLPATPEEIDRVLLASLLERHTCGVQLLSSPHRFEDAEQMGVRRLEHSLGLLRDMFSWVVLDVARSWSESSLRALELSDVILLVTALDVPALNHTRRQLELFENLGLQKKVRLVVNRRASSDPLTPKEVAKFLEREPDLLVPNDYARATAAIDRGEPIVRGAARSPLGRALRLLAARVHEWCGIPLELPPEPGLLERLKNTLIRRRDGTA